MEELRNGQSHSLCRKVSFNHKQGERAGGEGRAAPAPPGSESESQYDTGRSVPSHCTPYIDTDRSDHSETLHLTLSHNVMGTSFPCSLEWEIGRKGGEGAQKNKCGRKWLSLMLYSVAVRGWVATLRLAVFRNRCGYNQRLLNHVRRGEVLI